MIKDRYIGKGVNIAAAPDRRLWQERGGMVSDLVVMRRPVALANNYQTEGHVTLKPGEPKRIEVANMSFPPFTSSVGTRTDVLYVGPLDKEAMADIEKAKEHPSFKDSERGGPIIQIFPGVVAELYGFRQGEGNMLTTSVMNHSRNLYAVGDPRLKEGSIIGMHYDDRKLRPISELVQEQRRFVVNMSPDTIHYSLFVPEYNVFDLSVFNHSRDDQYMPDQPELYTELAFRSEGEGPRRASVMWTPLAYGEAVLLPAYTIIHDGSSKGQKPSRIAILHEPEWGWPNESFRAYTLFDKRALERQGYNPMQRAELAQMEQMAAEL